MQYFFLGIRYMLLANKRTQNSEKKTRGLFFEAKIYFVKKN